MRFFFALWPPPALAGCLAEQAQVCASHFGGRATRAETIHLTLAFLGEQPDARLGDIVAAARSLTMTPFDLSLDRFGAWRHNRLLWAGCREAPEALLALASSLRGALLQAGIRFDAERGFAPHLTLVRSLPDTAFPLALPLLAPLSWRCTGFMLMESRPLAGGAGYRCVAEFPAEG